MPNHWSNEEKMKEYVNNIILPYVKQKRIELKLSPEHPALAIFDVFKGQVTEDIFSLLEENNIGVVKGIQELTPIDLRMSIMKPLGARWLVSLHDYLKDHSSIIRNGFKAAGIVDFLSIV